MNITFLGDGIFALMVFFFLLLIKKTRPAIEVLISFICSGLLAQFLKFIFHAPRPKAFLEASQYSKFFEGVTNSGWNSFPSGHTTTAFAVATILAFYSTNTRVAVFYLLLALLVGYSRIYLGHHFLEDVLAGAVLGLISSCLVLKLTKNNSYTFSKEKKLFIE
ncbi:MAG: phosphatase PAP2 family protein [Chitinophagaceae bacterium]